MSWSRCWRWRQQRTCILAVVGGVGGNQYPPHILESIQTSLLISLLIGLFNPEVPGSYTTAIALRHQIGISRFSFHFNIFRVLTSLPIPHRAITFVLTKTKTLSGKWHNTQRDCLFREVERTKLKLWLVQGPIIMNDEIDKTNQNPNPRRVYFWYFFVFWLDGADFDGNKVIAGQHPKLAKV